jgi:hypothetical protein
MYINYKSYNKHKYVLTLYANITSVLGRLSGVGYDTSSTNDGGSYILQWWSKCSPDGDHAMDSPEVLRYRHPDLD